MLTQEQIKAGTLVKHIEKGNNGIVVPNCGECDLDHVMVDWDGVSGIFVARISELEVMGHIKVEFEQAACCTCIFSTGHSCHRFEFARAGWVISNLRSNRALPTRIYPFCKKETR